MQWSMHPYRIYGQVTPIVTTPFGSYVNHNHFAGLVGMGAVLAAGLTLASRAGACHVARRARPAAASPSASSRRISRAAAAAGSSPWSEGWPRWARCGWRRSRASAVAGAYPLPWWRSRWSWWSVSAGRAVPERPARHLATAFCGTDRRLRGVPRRHRGGHAASLVPTARCWDGDWAPTRTRSPPSSAHTATCACAHAESDVLEFCAEGGLVGLALAAWLMVAVLRGLRDRLTASRDRVPQRARARRRRRRRRRCSCTRCSTSTCGCPPTPSSSLAARAGARRRATRSVASADGHRPAGGDPPDRSRGGRGLAGGRRRWRSTARCDRARPDAGGRSRRRAAPPLLSRRGLSSPRRSRGVLWAPGGGSSRFPPRAGGARRLGAVRLRPAWGDAWAIWVGRGGCSAISAVPARPWTARRARPHSSAHRHQFFFGPRLMIKARVEL